MTTKKDIGLAIRTLRKKAGIKTQRELGKKLNPEPVSKGTINSVETGRGNYSINLLFRIAEVLNCDISDFFEEKSIGLAVTKDDLEVLRKLLGRVEYLIQIKKQKSFNKNK